MSNIYDRKEWKKFLYLLFEMKLGQGKITLGINHKQMGEFITRVIYIHPIEGYLLIRHTTGFLLHKL